METTVSRSRAVRSTANCRSVGQKKTCC